jgi:hypothetical protein
MICPVEIAREMSALRAVRLGDHGKRGVLLEGRDLKTSDLSRRQRLSFLRLKIVIPLSLPSRIFSCLLGQPKRIGGPKLGGHIPSRPVLTLKRSKVSTSTSRCTSILHPPDNTKANPVVDFLSSADFSAANSTPSSLHSARESFLFRFHRRFFRWRAGVLKLKPRLGQNSFRRMPLLGTPTLTAGLRLVFGAHAGLPSVLRSSCQFSTGPAPSQGVLVRRLRRCLVPAGGVVTMRPLIVHASSKSLTDMPRFVLHMEYAADLIIADQLELALA